MGALEAYAVVIENKKADVIFPIKSGETLRLRGAMDFRKLPSHNMDMDLGITSRVFRAQSIEVVKK